MKKKGLVSAGMLVAMTLAAGCGSKAAPAGNPVEANKLFSMQLPKETAGTYKAETTDNSISIYDKEASEAGFGGFAFSVQACSSPLEYAGGMSKKVGELTAKDGTLYDIVAEYPSDVQYDYTKNTEGMPASYAALYNGADAIIQTIQGVDGTFVYGAGTKGEELYPDVLAKHVQAINEGWDAERLESENMSSMYYAMSMSDEGSVLDRTGYAYFDVNQDGIDELLIGEIGEDEWKGTIYDVYTMVNREPAHVVSGWDRSRYFALDTGMLVNEYSGGAMESGWDTYDIEPNTTNLMPQLMLKYDGYEDEEKPWFVSYDDGETWEGVTEEEFEARKPVNYVRFDFTPLSSVK
ncbi:MAG: hypothetical protein IJT16_04665 [Lachnospiraceae bacterium]|nr:hypothetical protein [Lachnospiraceae bacterium]